MRMRWCRPSPPRPTLVRQTPPSLARVLTSPSSPNSLRRLPEYYRRFEQARVEDGAIEFGFVHHPHGQRVLLNDLKIRTIAGVEVRELGQNFAVDFRQYTTLAPGGEGTGEAFTNSLPLPGINFIKLFAAVIYEFS